MISKFSIQQNYPSKQSLEIEDRIKSFQLRQIVARELSIKFIKMS